MLLTDERIQPDHFCTKLLVGDLNETPERPGRLSTIQHNFPRYMLCAKKEEEKYKKEIYNDTYDPVIIASTHPIRLDQAL